MHVQCNIVHVLTNLSIVSKLMNTLYICFVIVLLFYLLIYINIYIIINII